MNRISAYLIALLFCLPVVSCSGNQGDEPDNPGQPETVWDKTRTVRILFISTLATGNPYNRSNYNTVANIASKSDGHILILDKTNVIYNGARVNTGAEIAVIAHRYPIFIPISKTATEYIGNSMFFKNTVPQMEQIVISEDCRMMQTSVEIGESLTANIATVSFDADSQVNAFADCIQSVQTTATLVTGTIKRSLVPLLESKMTTLVPEYRLEIMEHSDKNSEYCIYLLGTTKWKLRDFTEETIDNGSIKSFLLQAEILK